VNAKPDEEEKHLTKKSTSEKETKAEKVRSRVSESNGNTTCGCYHFTDDEVINCQDELLRNAMALVALSNKHTKKSLADSKFVLEEKPTAKHLHSIPPECKQMSAADKADLSSLARCDVPIRREFSDHHDLTVQLTERMCHVKVDGGYYHPNTPKEELHFRRRPGSIDRVDCTRGCSNYFGKGFKADTRVMRGHMKTCTVDAPCESQEEFDSMLAAVKSLLEQHGRRPSQKFSRGKLRPDYGFPSSNRKEYRWITLRTGLEPGTKSVCVGERKEALVNAGFKEEFGFFP
jgi:hypothetical protein